MAVSSWQFPKLQPVASENLRCVRLNMLIDSRYPLAVLARRSGSSRVGVGA